MDFNEIISHNLSLPAAQIAADVNKALEKYSSVVVTAPPSAGKSTLLPLTIMAGLNNGAEGPDRAGKVLMLEPRRLAAKQIAERMAQMIGEPVGQTVGYRVRFDEFHERSINSDLALALTRQAQEIIRPDIKIVIMSATIDASSICNELKAPLIESEGRMFDVDITNAERWEMPQRAAAATVEAHNRHKGDILVFLPGQGEIERCQQLLGSSLQLTRVLPLYGNLPPEQQRKAIAPSREGERKVVLATPIAETSITIEGVRVVVDSGLCRQMVFDAHTGLSHLETVRISMDMATQRSGRAGRVAEGVCYRLWTKASEHLMAEQRKPEIEEADLAPMLLDIAAFGTADECRKGAQPATHTWSHRRKGLHYDTRQTHGCPTLPSTYCKNDSASYRPTAQGRGVRYSCHT